jgi:hypothetical protein
MVRNMNSFCFGFWGITPCSPLKVNQRLLSVNGRHEVISQKIELFVTTAVRTSDPTQFQFYFLASCAFDDAVSARKPYITPYAKRMNMHY